MVENYEGDPVGSPVLGESGHRVETDDGISWTLGRGGPSCPTPMRMSRSRRSTGETADFSMACGRAGCPVCGPALGLRQVESFTAAFVGRPDLYLGTFTVEPSFVRALGGPYGARSYMAHAFGSSFRPRVARRCREQGGSLAYLAVPERHTSGAPHLHVLAQAGLPEGVLRGQAYAAGFAPSMSIRPVEPDRVSVRGAVRYVLKNAFGPERRLGERAVWASRGLGYYGAEARAARRDYVAAKGVTPDDDIVVEPAYDRIAPRRRPQGITAEDKERFEAIRSGRRRDRFVERSADGRRGIRHTYGSDGSYCADALVIDRVDDGQTTVVVAENVSPEDARRHLAGELF